MTHHDKARELVELDNYLRDPSGGLPWEVRIKIADAITAQAEENRRLRDALLSTAASLAAAISLLERGGKAAKKGAPSDKMFDQMLADYRKSLEAARAALSRTYTF